MISCCTMNRKPTQIVRLTKLSPQVKVLPETKLLVTVKPYGNEFEANFMEARISICGATSKEALKNLKALLVDTFLLYLEYEKTNSLGRGPQQQLAVLKTFLCIV